MRAPVASELSPRVGPSGQAFGNRASSRPARRRGGTDAAAMLTARAGRSFYRAGRPIQVALNFPIWTAALLSTLTSKAAPKADTDRKAATSIDHGT